jgi:aminomethyltransferase
MTLEGKAFPRQGYTIHIDGGTVGTVTSGTFSPTLEKGIAMGYVAASCAKPGTEVSVAIRGKQVPATVVSLPFVKK